MTGTWQTYRIRAGYNSGRYSAARTYTPAEDFDAPTIEAAFAQARARWPAANEWQSVRAYPKLI